MCQRTGTLVLPQGVNMPPNRDSHENYIKELEHCLSKIEANPEGFENSVRMRRRGATLSPVFGLTALPMLWSESSYADP